MKKWHLYLIMWTSWAWKWILRKKLEQAKLTDLEFIKSYVTREMREGEVNWDIYNFILEDSFKEMIDNKEFLEYEYVHNYAYYWTKLEDVEKGISNWKKIMKEMEIEWLKSIYSNTPEFKENITTIFLSLSENKLSERIASRWVIMSEEEFKNRLKSLVKEVEEAKQYCDFIIDTSEKTPEDVFEEVLYILK